LREKSRFVPISWVISFPYRSHLTVFLYPALLPQPKRFAAFGGRSLFRDGSLLAWP